MLWLAKIHFALDLFASCFDRDIVSDKNVFLIGRFWVWFFFVDHKLGFHSELSRLFTHFFFLASLTSKQNGKNHLKRTWHGVDWRDHEVPQGHILYLSPTSTELNHSALRAIIENMCKYLSSRVKKT